jgi:hypothetical protein
VLRVSDPQHFLQKFNFDLWASPQIKMDKPLKACATVLAIDLEELRDLRENRIPGWIASCNCAQPTPFEG